MNKHKACNHVHVYVQTEQRHASCLHVHMMIPWKIEAVEFSIFTERKRTTSDGQCSTALAL